ncbi:unnamed protein product [Didymodactylos carnosus]|uniref:Threonyl-tRNA synthetase n=1 Tax=Didymodactylos carnosus TaxID=1234261 RepID=A0A8S2CJU3_9BILA|nr:unnamed protein product [Didymodactylos carnosus]CAF3491692.1 unnamed protein product [Didymodactylos carnosus]
MIGEAAFYGPKIDFQYLSVLGHEITLSTVQLDFLLPERFELEYKAADGSLQRPVMIHVGVASTLERLVATLLEQTKGVLLTWLAPIQAILVPVNPEFHLSAVKLLAKNLKNRGIRVEIDDRDERLSRRIRDAHFAKAPFVLVVGDEEVKNSSLITYLNYVWAPILAMTRTLAFDLDGTLTNSNHEIPLATAAFLSTYTKKQPIYIITGRSLQEVKYHVQKARIRQGFVLCYGGGMMYSIEQNRTIETLPLPPPIVDALIHVGGVNGMGMIAIKSRRNEGFNPAQATSEHEPAPEERITEIREVIARRYRVHVFSTESNDIVITQEGTRKYPRLVKVLQQHGIDPLNVIYFGDGIVDIESLRGFGYGVAMGNGLTSVKEAAKEVTLSNDEEGVLY